MLALSDNQTEFQNVPDNAKSSDFLIETLERLRHEYAEMLPAKIDEVEAAANGLADKRSDAHEETALKDLRNLAHKLAGSGATFGFAAMGETARNLEKLTDMALDSDGALSERFLRELLASVTDLRAVATLGADTAIVPLRRRQHRTNRSRD